MANRTSLRKIIIKLTLIELFYTIFILFILVVTFNLSINLDLVYPANHAERQLPAFKEQFVNGKLGKEDIPSYYEYQLTENGSTSQTIPPKFTPLIRKAKENGYSQTDRFIATRVFVYYKQENRELVLSYRLMATFVSEKLDRILPPPEIIYFVFFLLLWLSGFLLIIQHYVSRLRLELAKVSKINEEIKRMNLDYTKEKSQVKEVQEMLDSLDNMNKHLKQALKKQWAAQQHQKELVQSVTHDIRTPITLVKGNLELLEENQMSTSQNEQLADLTNGVKRLEQYVEQLKVISGIMEENSTRKSIDSSVLREWINLATGLTKSHDMNLQILRQDTSTFVVDKKQLTNALQNVIVNSIEHSLPHSQLTLSFEDDSDKYRIIVQDQGSGFSRQALKQATKRNFTTNNRSEEVHYGLGLSIVDEILAHHNGKLKIENVLTEGKVTGAKVTMILYKANTLVF